MSGTFACPPYLDDNGCTVWPYCPPVAHVPAYIESVPNNGWNAGANSIIELGGNFHTVFPMPAAEGGVIIGLRTGRPNPAMTARIEHGMFFQSAGVANLVQVIEGNVTKTEPVTYEPTDQFEIRRVGNRVTYWQGGVILYTSQTPSFGAKVVNACLYASGDNV